MLKDIVKNIDLFKSLDENKIDKLIDIAFLEKIDKGYTIFHQGDDSNYLYILISGIVQVNKFDDMGNPIIIGVFSTPSLIGEAASLKGVPFPSSATTKSEVQILKIKTIDFCNEFLNDITVAKEIINSLLGKVQLLQQNIHNNIASTAKDKIINFYATNKTLADTLKQYEIAHILGISVETLSRNLKILVKEEILIKKGRRYYLNN